MPHGSHGCAHHHDTKNMDERALIKAIIANVLLTGVQIIGGIASGSLSLVADALHNLSDAASLFLAIVAIRIGKKPADQDKTFGYKRAETIAALINLTTLIAIGLYLIGEAVRRLFIPEAIIGWSVIVIASIALIVDLYTAALTYKESKNSLNMKAAFLHSLTDALASVGVIIAGVLIMLYEWYWADTVMTFIIAGYVIYHGIKAMPEVIHILMQGTPAHLSISEIETKLGKSRHVKNIHHTHVWYIDEDTISFEAHVTLTDLKHIPVVKKQLKKVLHDDYNIHHSTLEFETEIENCDSC